MIDFDHNRNCCIFNELSKDDLNSWFDFRNNKNLRNIDNMYYTVKLKNDFTEDSSDLLVLKCRSIIESKRNELYSSGEDSLSYFVENYGNVNLLPKVFERIYKFWMNVPDYFDVIVAPFVPVSSSGESVTPQIYVQIRAYLIWQYGVSIAFQKSYDFVKAFVSSFGFEIESVLENRIDFCWHTNYFLNPEKYFNMDNFFKLQVSRFKKFQFLATRLGSEGFTVDYIATTRRSSGIFFRIYNKTREVLEQGYKSWFFDVWCMSGLINNYDKYCYELALKQPNKRIRYDYLFIARLHWYVQYGRDDHIKSVCNFYIQQYEKYNMIGDDIIKFVDSITPHINVICNIEYACGRRFTKTIPLAPLHDIDNTVKYKEAARIYNVMDNGYLLGNFLLLNILKMVSGSDSNKSRRPLTSFWQSLVRTKSFDFKRLPDGLKLKREHFREINEDIVKRRLINNMASLSLYHKGINDDDFSQDFVDIMGLLFNDNDLQYGNKAKHKRSKTLSPEFSKISSKEVPENFCIINREDGSIYDHDNIMNIYEDLGFFDE